jgi:APA family basic amino acid/polyamine antiporter
VIVALTALNYRGITKTAGLARVLVTLTLLALGTVVVAIFLWGNPHESNLTDWNAGSNGGIYGVLQASGLLFFAFAGYARIATLSEEVRDPKRTIPRAIPIALGITVAVYAIIAVTILAASGADQIAGATAPLVTAVESAGVGEIALIVRLGGTIAATGALLALIAGIGRTALAMARNRDLPSWLAAVHPDFRVPHHAEIALAVVVSTVVLLVDLRGAIGFSSFGVLIYYAIANASAWTQESPQRQWPRALNAIGLIGCLVLVATLPVSSILAGLAMFAIGLAGRFLVLRRRDAQPAAA